MRFGRDRVAGIVLLGLGGLLLALTEGLPKPALVPIGPAFYPRIVIIVLIGLAVLLVLQDARAPAARARTAIAWPALGLVAAAFALAAVYVGLLPLLGFRLATFLFVAAFQCLLAPPRRPADGLRVALVALATTALSWLVFERELSVLLPRGRWSGW